MENDGCGRCRHAEEIPWEKNKKAVRCMKSGEWSGRVVAVFPTNIKDCECVVPVWCGGFEER